MVTSGKQQQLILLLVEDLRYIPEGFLGQRFTELLLSRYVLMDATARYSALSQSKLDSKFISSDSASTLLTFFIIKYFT